MPPARVSRRRKSSLAIGVTPVRPGNYGINTPSPRNVTFAPNITPGTYVESDSATTDDSEPPSPADAIFPPSETPASAPSRRRVPPGKRRSLGYIPRPPNAFMLFRADFVRQKHVPGSIETNHGSLSKIIGNCWRALPLEEKRIWENRAKKAKAEHRERYPNYRFRPIHNKHKKQAAAEAAAKRKEKVPAPVHDERRCEEVAQLLLEGKKGDELAAAVRRLDYDRVRDFPDMSSPMLHMPAPLPAASSYTQLYGRRSSSVPPNLFAPVMAIPSLPFLTHPAHSLSRPDTPPNFFDTFGGMSNTQSNISVQTYNPHVHHHPDLALSISPLDSISVDPLSSASTAQTSAYPYYTPDTSDPHLNTMQWVPSLDCSSSGPSSAFSGSPAPSDVALPHQYQNVAPDQSVAVLAPQPQQPVAFDGWHDGGNVQQQQQPQIAMAQHQLSDFTELDFMPEYTQSMAPTAMYAPHEVAHCGVAPEAYAYHDDMGMQIPQY
ncbi:hypothetical protein NLI96_g7302 [Meripilus lineatus]|uniref:HMG box domain-containing protein n=1 Tax=Meripilus lineatus TaxID=2056292 RepID=A0AAD5V4N4_9APHY|nr:hypothetical protein NLI96_g7302 [Physisporinus lineatus]